MFFLGHFSFDEMADEEKPRHGYFTCVVQADTPDDAALKFKSYIKGLKESEPLFSDVLAVYIEDLISIENVTEQPFLLRMQSSSGQFPDSKSHSFPLGKTPGMEAYGWAPNVRAEEAQSPDASYKETKPFLLFE